MFVLRFVKSSLDKSKYRQQKSALFFWIIKVKMQFSVLRSFFISWSGQMDQYINFSTHRNHFDDLIIHLNFFLLAYKSCNKGASVTKTWYLILQILVWFLFFDFLLIVYNTRVYQLITTRAKSSTKIDREYIQMYWLATRCLKDPIITKMREFLSIFRFSGEFLDWFSLDFSQTYILNE